MRTLYLEPVFVEIAWIKVEVRKTNARIDRANDVLSRALLTCIA